MIARIWNGYATNANAPAYESLLQEKIIPSIEQKNISGFKGLQLLKRDLGNETAFTTIMWFESMDAVKQFAGEDFETAHVPAESQAILSRFDGRSVHCELRYDNLAKQHC